MKIHQNRNINTSSTSRRKQTDGSKFGSTATPDQQRIVFEQATELLDQALEQWEADGSLTESTMTSIQKARQQLGLLSSQAPALAQAETMLAVESKRLQILNH